MPRITPRTLILIAVITIASLIYLAGVSRVPFHPDESTYLYMSSDFETFYRQPSVVFWQSEPADELRQHYRLVDPPLLRSWIGFVRWLTGQPVLAADWDWSKSWQENQAAGALPSPGLVQTARLAVALLFPLTLIFMFLAGKQLGGELTGWISILLTLSSALILLHTRRAMAEGLLVLGVAASLWALTAWRKRPWLCALPIALAFNAKYSAAPLIVVGIIAILWNQDEKTRSRGGRFLQLAAFLAIFGGLTLLLNPFMWTHPIEALTAAVNSRAEFMADQAVDFAGASSLFAPKTGLDSFTAMLAQLFFTPPAFAEVSNYLAETHAASNAYLANPFNNLLRGPFGGGVQLGLFLLGMITVIRSIFSKPIFSHKRGLILFLIAFLLEAIFMLITTNVAFQRYYMVLLPMVILMTSLGIASLIHFFIAMYKSIRPKKNNEPESN